MRFSHLFILLSGLSTSSVSGMAQAASIGSTDAVSASMELARPVAIWKTRDLDFGALFVSAAGTAAINPNNGALTTTGGVTWISGTAHAAEFRVAASRSALILIRLPTAPVTLTRSGGTQTMTVTNWTLTGFPIKLIVGSGSLDFRVGGRLNIAAGQAEGIYQGTFAVTAEYY